MREPIVEFIRSNLLLGAAVGVHPPDLHGATPFGIEVYPLAIGRIIRAVVEPFGRRETFLFAAENREQKDEEGDVGDEGDGDVVRADLAARERSMRGLAAVLDRLLLPRLAEWLTQGVEILPGSLGRGSELR